MMNQLRQRPDPDTRQSSAMTRLRVLLSRTEPALRAASAELWSQPGLAQRYPRYLHAMHGVLRASVPLMERAALRCAELESCDPCAGRLRRYLETHAAEERDHDAWLLDDLAALGGDRAAVIEEQPCAAVARLVGPQYYWIEHHHPVALLGYIAVLEGNAPHTGLAAWIAGAAEVPDSALRTVREHAELDTAHTEDIHRLLDDLALTDGQVRAITVSALCTAQALIGLFDHLVRIAPGRAPARRPPTRLGAGI